MITRDADGGIAHESCDGDVEAQIDKLIKESYSLLKPWESKENNQKGIAALKKAIELGSVEALFLLGEEYNNGWSVEKDRNRAIELFTQAAEKKHQGAVNQLIEFYYSDEDGGPHFEHVMLIIEEYTNITNGYAFYMKGRMYLYGLGVAYDIEEALRSLTISAEIGKYLPAMKSLERFFEYGHEPDINAWDFINIPQDLIKAAKYHELAAQQGDMESQYKLAMVKLEGKGTTKDYHGAFLWFWRSALQSYGPAQVELAKFYLSEHLFPEDMPTALLWLLISQNNIVDNDAKVLINDLEMSISRAKLMKLQKEAIKLNSNMKQIAEGKSELLQLPEEYIELHGFSSEEEVEVLTPNDSQQLIDKQTENTSGNDDSNSPFVKWGVQNAKDITIVLNFTDHDKSMIIKHKDQNQMRFRINELFGTNLISLLVKHSMAVNEGKEAIGYHGFNVAHAKSKRKNYQIVSDFNTRFRELMGKKGDRDFCAFEWIGRIKSQRSLKAHIRIEVFR